MSLFQNLLSLRPMPRLFGPASCFRGSQRPPRGGGGGSRVYVIGVGMTKFEKPGRRENFDYPEMAGEAVKAALQDGRVAYEEVEQAVVGYVYGDSTCGQRALYPLGKHQTIDSN